jgi:hypothetical protein
MIIYDEGRSLRKRKIRRREVLNCANFGAKWLLKLRYTALIDTVWRCLPPIMSNPAYS